MSDASETSPPGEGSVEISFEVALDRLEQIVARLEGGDLELEEALTAFEEGVKLSRHCAARIEAAQRRIEILVGQGEDMVATRFEAEEESG